jgi:formylglycine-generating enzyme required for sulfatase activity
MRAIYSLRHGLGGLCVVILVLALANRMRAEGQEDAVPKSAAAVAARTKRDAAVEKAQGVFTAAKMSADKQYLDDLSNALKLAMKAGNLDEAERIDIERSRMDSTKTEGVGKETEPPKTTAATAAKTRHEAAMKKAEAAFRSARILADKQYRSDLTAPLPEAMKASDLEEAKRLDAARKVIDAEITELEHGGAPGHPNAASYAGTNKLGIKFIRIERGEFDMGSPDTEAGREANETPHHVKITKPFLMAATPVTQAQWKAVMGTNPSHSKGDDRPVDTVSWNDAVAFCEKLSINERRHYRLPTEAEWEYACRAGTQTPFAGTGELADMGWFSSNSDQQTHPVAQKKPNDWGLYDMHGNVWQWCSDGYGPYGGDAVDPKGAKDTTSRMNRGGGWSEVPSHCRAAYRKWNAPGAWDGRIGFRICLDM